MILVLVEFLTLIILYGIPAAKTAPILANETDYRALLAFKGKITSDPFDALSSWNDSVHFCAWNGVTCGRKHTRVTGIELRSLRLAGTLSPQIGNLTFLRVLILNDNVFTGVVPQVISRLSRLQNFGLANNSFEGEFPKNLTNCANLWIIDLLGNNLEGRIPDGLGSLWNLTKLGLSKNRFTGTIPPSLGNLSALTHLHLAGNHLKGSVPPELGKLSRLISFQLSSNNLSGPIPLSLYNISSIQRFSIVVNNVSGSLPSDLFLALPKLQGFYLGVNSFSGPLPATIANASELIQIDISQNFFTGPIPAELGGLKKLEVLNFGWNPLGTEQGDDLRFLASLTNCTDLRLLWSQMNGLKGALPDSIGNFSNTFTSLMLDHNLISGTIPSGIGKLVNLELLWLNGNKLAGSIPDSMGKLSKLKSFLMDQNNLSGAIPPSLGNMTSLIDLSLGENMLEGTIPTSIGNCVQLNSVYLSQNRLVGPLPEQLFAPSLLIYLLVARNHFTGQLSSRVGNLINLRALQVAGNNMSGALPATLGSCQVMELLSLRQNQFNGTIPSSLNNLRGLQHLDFSRNNFSGQIPGFLGDLPFLGYLDLSSNMFEGEVPKGRIFGNSSAVSVAGNSKICGGPPVLQLPKCKIPRAQGNRTLTWRIVLAICVSVAIVFLSAGIIAIVLYRSKRSRTESITDSLHQDLYSKFSYKELSQATDGFSPSNMIGEGSFGTVYKGIIQSSEEIVAVKVLKPEKVGADKSFMAECEALRNIRHRNLVKTITSCSTADSQGNNFKALVFEYMPNGSLEKWLHAIPNETGGKDDSTTLTIVQRLNIALDVVAALHYLHHQCQIPIVHCDLKPSNVLLDCDFTAHLSDFGLAKFLVAEESVTISSSIGIRGTIGYVAPEYGFGGKASTRGDVYSFGILLLEMFTGKAPTGAMFGGNFSLREFVEKALLQDGLMQVLDPILCLGEVEGKLSECLVSVLRVGLMCSTVSPNERMDIGEALKQLHKARDVLTH